MKSTEFKSYRLDGLYTLLSALSHIGESTGPDAWLATEPVVDLNGQIQETFVYSGNSIRGILRDAGIKYLLDKLGGVKLPPETFHLLFSGGTLGGESSVDIDQARLYRKMLPMFSILGGGVGNQLLPGKVKIGSLYPLVKECQRLLPEELRDPEAPSWKKLSMEKSFTRMDDTKDENKRQYLAAPKQEAQQLLEGEVKDAKKKGEQKQQMRATVEMMVAGTRLYQRIDLCDLTELELGAWVSAWHEFSRKPYIGGKSGTGYGLVELKFTYREPYGENIGIFLAVNEGRCELSPPAAEAKEKYDAFLLDLYNAYLEDKAGELKQLLGGKPDATA